MPDAADSLPRQTVTETKSILAHDIVEAIVTGGPSDRAVVRLTPSAATLDWDIHGHANGSTQNIEEGFAVASVDYAFVPTLQADWFLLLRNSGDAPFSVDLEIDLYGDMTWGGWQQ